MTEREKMLAGDWYDANYDADLLKERADAADLCYEFDQKRPNDFEGREEVLKKILNMDKLPEGLEVLSPFLVDYGFHVHFGRRDHIGHGCFFMDGADITMGDDCFIGPDCGFYTASHPLKYEDRNKGLEKALPIVIGSNCWFGAKVSVMPGVHIGNGCVIAAGAVVTHDIEDNSLAAGVPAEVKKKINQ